MQRSKKQTASSSTVSTVDLTAKSTIFPVIEAGSQIQARGQTSFVPIEVRSLNTSQVSNRSRGEV